MQSIYGFNGFVFGVNYWASHAATQMWSNWNEAVVENDFKLLSEAGVSMLRVFPIWSDFQPVRVMHSMGTAVRDFRFGEEPLPDTDAGRAGVSAEMIERFGVLLSLAEKYNLKIIVALVTGMMSSRMFYPPALENMDLLTNPSAIKWTVRYVKYFVKHFKENASIVGWDLGNECEYIQPNTKDNVDAQWLWATVISDAIRSEDKSRPVISGVDVLQTDGDIKTRWQIFEHAEAVDILTEHNYHIFSNKYDPIHSMRPTLRAVAETRLYEDIGGKPCFIEEIGAIGYTNCGEKVESEFARALLFSAWAHNCHGLFWWCAFDQGTLTFAPYDWNNLGSDYGLLKVDGTAKPVATECKACIDAINNAGLSDLPGHITDAVCIIRRGLGDVVNDFSSNIFCLAKQAGIDVEFQHADSPIKDSPMYLMPNFGGSNSITRHRLMEVLKKVEDGAVLYLSLGTHGDGLFRMFPEITGIHVSYRERPVSVNKLNINGKQLSFSNPFDYYMESVDGEVLAFFDSGLPAIVMHPYGKGKIITSLVCPEEQVKGNDGVFSRKDAPDYFEIYRMVASYAAIDRAAFNENRFIGLTEHKINQSERIVVAINYDKDNQPLIVGLKDGWKIQEVLYSAQNNIKTIRNNDAVVFKIARGG